MRYTLFSDGTTALATPSSSFAIQRVRPGVVVLRAKGHDRGELGAGVLAELDAEIARFGMPLSLFVDATEARSVAFETQLAWTCWLEARRSSLAALHASVIDPNLALVLEIAAHRARLEGRLVLHRGSSSFSAALERAAPGGCRTVGEEVALVTRRSTAGLLDVTDGACSYRVAADRDRIAVTIDGFDRGALGSRAFDAIGAHLSRGSRHLSFDLRAATPPAAGVADLWSGWLGAHRRRIASMHVVSASRRVGLTVSIAAHRAGLGSRVRIDGV